MWIHLLGDAIKGRNKEAWKKGRLRGTVVLVKKDVLGFNDYHHGLLGGDHEFLLGPGVEFLLVSATVGDQNNSNKGKLGKAAQLEESVATAPSLAAGESTFRVSFEWDKSQGIPGAVVVRSRHHSEFFLKTVAVDGVPGRGRVVFVANSWIYPAHVYKYDRIFFSNNTYLPSKMPAPLRAYREEELQHLRGDDIPGPYETHDRIYRYDYYNDLGQPDKGEEHARPVLGGSQEFPYPRRGRTGRHPTQSDPNSESRLPALDIDIYVPRDERFGHLKMADFVGNAIKVVTEAIQPLFDTFVNRTPNEFDSFQDILNLYEGGPKMPNIPQIDEATKRIPFEFLKDILPGGGENFLRLPLPHVIKESLTAWRTDEEFAREMLAAVNPVVIRRLTEFPPTSKLDPMVYGNQTSTITEAQIETNMQGMKVHQALKENRLYILDHHDHFMPYLDEINSLKGNFIYATRTVLFLNDDSTLKPLAIELSLPHPEGKQHGTVSKVYTAAEGNGVESSVWQLAKAYVAVNDSGWHQLISHWLNTHAVIEPFVIATNRQLSVMHPVYKLLSPHYRDTMNINALARQTLINADGLFEKTVFPGKYALGISSIVYKDWKLTEQALPDDLAKRGVAVEDPSSPFKVRLLIKDYPYAVDGLLIWWAIEQWVNDYCTIYYSDSNAVWNDSELQAWWKEVREVGHGDKKDESWWPKMQTLQDLTKTCATIIWVASALHAAVNFGQYPYAGYLPNRPTISRRPMPEPDTPDYAELRHNPDKVFISTITSQLQTILGISLVETLSKHSADEVYLGQRDTAEWTSDTRALAAFKRFGVRLSKIEERIMAMNQNQELKNRNGPVKMPYMLLYPNTTDLTHNTGIAAKGIPNSISI